MELLKQRIISDGRILDGNILKVDSFLNHQLDVELLSEIGKAFHEIYGGETITKILTAESSGIAIAALAAQYFKVPVIFARKTQSVNLDPETFQGSVYSYTKKTAYKIRVAKRFLQPEDRVLILDDFLANGEAIKGLNEIVEASGATLIGAGVVIEKSYQKGAGMLKEMGIPVKALVQIESMSDGEIKFSE
jgi:xanthine phosphoribosyltransferase